LPPGGGGGSGGVIVAAAAVVLLNMEDLEPSYEYSPTGFPVTRPIQYFGLAFRSPNTVRLVNVDQHIASCVQEKVEQLLPVEKSGYVCFREAHKNVKMCHRAL
jgi:hypothetical protein